MFCAVGRYCACPIEFCTEVRDECRRIDWRKHLRQTFSLRTLKQRVPIVGWLPKYRCGMQRSCLNLPVFLCLYCWWQM